jgi:cephalosporin hydroxylase
MSEGQVQSGTRQNLCSLAFNTASGIISALPSRGSVVCEGRTVVDDTNEFRAAQREHSRELGADEDLQRLSIDITAASDRHHYSYVWRWLGLPIIQMPTDVVVMQELIWENRPQVIVETGIARGGSVILYASLLELIGEGTVVAVDIDIRSHNRRAIETHPLGHRIQLIEGSSTDASVVGEVAARAMGAERVMVVLDSNHTEAHVLAELRSFGPMVTAGQYLVVADTIVEYIPAQNRPRPWGPGNNPKTALDLYLEECDRFVVDEEINGKLLMSSTLRGYLRCIKQ